MALSLYCKGKRHFLFPAILVRYWVIARRRISRRGNLIKDFSVGKIAALRSQ